MWAVWGGGVRGNRLPVDESRTRHDDVEVAALGGKYFVFLDRLAVEVFWPDLEDAVLAAGDRHALDHVEDVHWAGVGRDAALQHVVLPLVDHAVDPARDHELAVVAVIELDAGPEGTNRNTPSDESYADRSCTWAVHAIG